MNLQILFIGVFALVALVVSAFCGFLIGNNFGHILLVTVLSMVAFSIFGFGIHAFLEKKVPEFLDFLSNFGEGFSPIVASDSGNVGGGYDYTSHPGDSESSSGGESPNAETFVAAASKPQKSGNFGDHIMVENIAIKNEPKLMAEAIRTMLARDDMDEK
ncbi:hypothetical protein [Leptospira santarosai]|uniref:hypothetical protein n=1 Tax=Leptospira santarosai TaxID=28183 RepID=UPI0002D4F085|nr:hypothetical protein [Leptospira santarosai]MDI7189969.1 hypothetical protein [Leptospira santarosai]MDI7210886.1 hypothetical protein [Leptospira santarosai]MDI7214388.1 hypothetical protein [Leptospira santarosai]MDI7221137.1 hypothetical protein [Leptospira santarosai]